MKLKEKRKALQKPAKPVAPQSKKAMLSPAEKSRLVAKATRMLGGG